MFFCVHVLCACLFGVNAGRNLLSTTVFPISGEGRGTVAVDKNLFLYMKKWDLDYIKIG